VSKIVGESLPDEVMLLQGAEGVLKDAVFGAGLHRLQQIRKVVGFIAADSQQVLRSIEIERSIRFANRGFWGRSHKP
jgi:hypothetical protein